MTGSRSMEQGEGPPWSWMKGRRRRRKLPREEAAVLPTNSHFTTPISTTKPTPAKSLESITPGDTHAFNFISNFLSRPSTEINDLRVTESPSSQGFHAVAGGRQHGEAGESGKVILNITRAIPSEYDLISESLPNGASVAERYDTTRERKGPIDFRVTKTGDFGGFIVTKTEEVDPISGFSVTKHEAPDSDLELSNMIKQPKQKLQRQVIEVNKVVPEKEEMASKQEKLIPTLGHTRETPLTTRELLKEGHDRDDRRAIRIKSSLLSADVESSQASQFLQEKKLPEQVLPRTSSVVYSSPPPAAVTDAPQNKAATLHISNVVASTNMSDVTTTTNTPSGTQELDLNSSESYSEELSQMKHLTTPTKIVTKYQDAGSVIPTDENHIRLKVTTLSSIFSEDLIPPLPYQWGAAWKSRGLQRTSHTDPEINSDVGKVQFHLPSQIEKNKGEDRVEGYRKGTDTTSDKIRYSESDESWRGGFLVQHPGSPGELSVAASPPTVHDALSPQDHRQEKKDGSRGGSQVVEVRQALGKADLRGSSWPGPGERVEFVTVVPGGHWDVWGGPPLWDSLAPRTNHSLRTPQVYSVYWGDTGGPGSPAGWPEGVWVIRGGSLAAIMALVVTISVQVARDGPAHRATPTADALHRAHHSQHATLATNLATSLASAHILLIFGIQATGKAWVCGVVGLLLHFLHLVSCCWLLALTGRLLGSLLHRRPLHTALYCTASWGASLALVVIDWTDYA
nr:uncharacterized protein LOC128697907 [Cherax quadricarinatus]